MTSLKTPISEPLSQQDRDRLRDLPPEARMRAMHKKLPRSWRGPLIGVGITIAVHLVIVGVVWVRSSKIEAPVNVFFPLMFPLAEQKPADAGPAPDAAPKPQAIMPAAPAEPAPEAVK